MRLLLLACYVAGMICGCTPAVKQPIPNCQTFIVWYDSEIGKEPLMQHAKDEKAEIIYEYQNFNAMAFRIPIRNTIEQTRQTWEKIPGVLSVQPDQIMRLD